MRIYTHEELPQGSEEWLKVRLGKFGGTDAQAVATNGKGLETLCFEKAGEIITGRLKDFYTNADMERGNEFEKIARNAYEIRTGNLVTQVGYIELSKYIGVSPDGLVGSDGLVEIKCPKDANFIKFLIEKKPESKYLWQMQHQMYVSDRGWVDFIVFNDNLNRIEILRIERDESKIDKLTTGLGDGINKIEEILGKIDVNN